MPPHKQPSRNLAEKPQASKVPAGSTGKSALKPHPVVPQKKEASIPSFLDFVEPPPQDDDMDAELTQVRFFPLYWEYCAKSYVVLHK